MSLSLTLTLHLSNSPSQNKPKYPTFVECSAQHYSCTQLALSRSRYHALECISRPGLAPALALRQNSDPRAPAFAQLPGILLAEEANTIAPAATGFDNFVRALEEKNDHRFLDVQAALSKWGGHVDLIDVAFKGTIHSLLIHQSI